MSTIEKDLEKKEEDVSGGTCGIEKKPHASTETSKVVEGKNLEEGEKKAKSGGCGC
ncbi:MAG: hypothetical protein IAF58_03270 [Leptolyngbya sp.]|nr:hypothetical protein [Candidatus Melainabacteria bacterium]